MNQPQREGLSTRTIVLVVIAAAVLLPCLSLCTCSTCATLTAPTVPPPPAPDPAPAPAVPAPTAEEPAPPDPCAELDTAPLPDLAERASIELAPTITADRRVLVAIRTNLPRGTILMMDFEGTRFHGQSRVEFEGPCSVAGPFGPATGLPNGRYLASATTPMPGVQPAPVRAVIGREGERLRGPQVHRRSGTVVVEAEVSLALGDEEEAARSDQDVARERRAVRQELSQLLSRARSMDGLRQREDLVGIRECGDEMRSIGGAAAALERRANDIGDRELAGAARSMRLCGSCSVESARQFCPIVAETLRGVPASPR